MTKYYAGVGSRETPVDVQRKMIAVGKRLSELGFKLRSGGAIGADQAFETGVKSSASPTNMEIFVPWDGYEGKKVVVGGVYVMQDKLVYKTAYQIAGNLHPAWDRCSDGAKKMHTRNCSQVLGTHLNEPALFVLCWTPCGSETPATLSIKSGGTAMAIRVACANNIPVFNMFHADALVRLARLL